MKLFGGRSAKTCGPLVEQVTWTWNGPFGGGTVVESLITFLKSVTEPVAPPAPEQLGSREFHKQCVAAFEMHRLRVVAEQAAMIAGLFKDDAGTLFQSGEQQEVEALASETRMAAAPNVAATATAESAARKDPVRRVLDSI
ncbi:MAG: hypothetical protein NTX64_01290 [Elusimicrobia bacterium]|nr:hypothetical protein [Elusimicrobiota bacterium]